jgi:hypothetical protein
MDIKDLAWIGSTGDLISRLSQTLISLNLELQKAYEEINRLKKETTKESS